MRLAATAFASATLALLAVVLTGDPRLGVISFAVGTALGVAVRVATFRGIVAAILLFMIPPGVVGESSAMIAMIGAGGLCCVVMTYRPENEGGAQGLKGFALLAMAGPAAGLMIIGQYPLVLVYLVLAIVAVVAVTRRRFVQDLTRGLTVVFAVYAASYLLTLVIGFGAPLMTLEIGQRTIELYLPFTTTTSGPPIITNTRRGVPFVGEPGLAVFYLLPILATLFTPKAPRNRVRALILLALVALVTQSTATILVLVAVLFIGLTLSRIRRRSIGTGALAIVSAIIAIPALILPLFDHKTAVAGVSVEARGIGADGGHANINILVALGNSPLLAVCLIAGLSFAAVVAFRSISGTAMWLAFAATAVTAQPSQWQPGAWFVLVAYSLSLAVAREATAFPAQLAVPSSVLVDATDKNIP